MMQARNLQQFADLKIGFEVDWPRWVFDYLDCVFLMRFLAAQYQLGQCIQKLLVMR